MPKYHFLEQGKKLNKDNIVERIFALYNETIKEINENDTELNKEIAKLNKENASKTLNHFINESKKKLSNDNAIEFLDIIRFKKWLRERAFVEWRNILDECAYPSPELNKLKDLLIYDEKNEKYTLEELSEKVKQLIDPKYYNRVKTQEIDFIKSNDILEHLDKYADFLASNMPNEDIEAIGESVNNFDLQFDYKNKNIDINYINTEKTNEIINEINLNKSIDGKLLTDNEVDDYINSLNDANKLFTNPDINFNYLTTEKFAISRGLNKDLFKGINDTIKDLGFSPDAVKTVNYTNKEGFYLAVSDEDKEKYNKNIEKSEMEYSDNTKEGLKLIINKLHEYGFDKLNLKEKQDNMAIGLDFLINASKNYNDAINSNDFKERKKAAIYAKELNDTYKKTKEIMGLINKYFPTKDINYLGYTSDVDIINNKNIPTELRVDYSMAASLASLNNIASLINEKKWDIDEFINNPLKHMKQAYKEDYLDKVDIITTTKDLKGNDLLFNIAANEINDLTEVLSFNGIRIVNSLAMLDKENLSHNYAMYEIFNKNIDQPNYYSYSYKNSLAKEKTLDNLIINPNLSFKDLILRN